MAINLSAQHNSGFLPDILLLTLRSSGNPIKCLEEMLSLQPMGCQKNENLF